MVQLRFFNLAQKPRVAPSGRDTRRGQVAASSQLRFRIKQSAVVARDYIALFRWESTERTLPRGKGSRIHRRQRVEQRGEQGEGRPGMVCRGSKAMVGAVQFLRRRHFSDVTTLPVDVTPPTLE